MEQKKEDVFTKISNEFLQQLTITDLRSKSYVYLIVVDKRVDNNKHCLLPCRQGTPINGYVYDKNNDAVSASCVGHYEIGFINCSIQISIPNSGGWKKQVPLPFNAIVSLFNSSQSRLFKELQEKYKSNNFDFHFVQIAGCH